MPSNSPPSDRTAKPDFSAAIAAKREDVGPPTLAERVSELSIVCRDAAALEDCRRQAGQPPSQPAPWPPSTVAWLRQQARRFHE
jgi:hypothetical protein